VILATDGDFNVGQHTEEELEKMISSYRQSGIYLTCLGVGMGNYKDSKLELLSKKGNGNFAYLDSEKEAEKVLVKELTQTMYAVADDAYCLVHFNPGVAERYRLIGFDNKVNVVADSSSELEGGEVGSGHTFIAIIEYTPVKGDGNGQRLSPAKLIVNYKNPVDSVNRLSVYVCPASFTEFSKLDSCYRFAASLVMFGSMLKKSKYTKTLTWNEIIKMARSSYNEKDPLHVELIELMEKAKKIHGKPAKGRFMPGL
jgi:Ca-activated chloride channel family protein